MRRNLLPALLAVLGTGFTLTYLWHGSRVVQQQRGLRATPQTVHASLTSLVVPAPSLDGHYVLLRHDTHVGTRDWTPILALHKTKTGRALWQKENFSVDPECFSEQGNHFVGRRWDLGKTRELLIGVYETQTGKCVAEFPNKNAYSSALSADGRFLAVPQGEVLRVWDAHTKTERLRVAAPSLKDLSISPNGEWVAGIVPLPERIDSQYSCVARVWRVGQKQPAYELPVNTQYTHLRFSEDSKTLFLTGDTQGYPLGLYPALRREEESYNSIGQLVETIAHHYQQVAEEAYKRRPVPELGKVGLLAGNALRVSGSYGASGVLAFSLTEGKPRWAYYAETNGTAETLTTTNGRVALCTSNQLLVLDEVSGKLLHQASLTPETRPRWLHFVEDGNTLLGQETINSAPKKPGSLVQYRWELSRTLARRASDQKSL
ncbi:hypothetical protein [Armatimonas sp.]|uniref:WD40 repeat domain-containing protein n=1 Tax=Armatimonas sp. TaxID=1872638 RepID=UPI00286A03F7|nr:hypothetical protein [Armatimonas sp.]